MKQTWRGPSAFRIEAVEAKILIDPFYPISRTGTTDGAAALQARTRHKEVTDEGDCGDRSGRGNGRDEVGGRPEPQAAINDVVVQIHASAITGDEVSWPSTWTDCAGRDRAPSIPGHELAGVVTALGYGTTGLSIGQRVFGLTDWYRDGTLAEYVSVEART